MATNGSAKQDDLSRIPVAYLILGYENNRQTIIDFYRNAESTVNWVIDAIQPPVTSEMKWLIEEIFAARSRGVKCKTVADITNDNLPHCKEIMTRIDELRHLSGIGVLFGVSDIEFLALAPSFAPREEIKRMQLIHSDSESVVGYKRLCFDLLWDRATPAQSRIDELEGKTVEGSGASTETAKTMIDRIYACKVCHQTFIHPFEVEDHRKTTGHDNFRAYPIV